MSETAVKTVGDFAGLLRRRWQYPVLIVPAFLLLATLVAYLLPVTYRSTGTIMLEPQSLPVNMVPTTVTGQIDIRETATVSLELVRRRVMSRENLMLLVQESDPYPQFTDLDTRGKADLLAASTSVQSVDPITYKPLARSMAFSISHNNPDPKLAVEVAGKIVDLFLSYNQKNRAEQAQAAYAFLESQANQLETSMVRMEKGLAVFRSKYGEALPDAEGRNLAGVDRSSRELDNLQRQILDAEQRQSLLELQAGDVSPSLTVAVNDWRVELARLRGELAIAEQKYTPEHPDVRRLKRSIADLMAQSASQPAATGTPDNPDYLRIQSQLAGARREVNSLRASAARIRGDLFSYQRNLTTAPNVESEYTQLLRDYQNAQTSYADIQDKMKSAALAQSLETEARGERFALMKAPSTPRQPFEPNRLGIILFGFVLGAGVALMACVIADASDPTVRSVEDLQAIMGTTPVGAVPRMLNRADRRHLRWTWGSVTAAYGVAAVVIAIVVLERA